MLSRNYCRFRFVQNMNLQKENCQLSKKLDTSMQMRLTQETASKIGDKYCQRFSTNFYKNITFSFSATARHQESSETGQKDCWSKGLLCQFLPDWICIRYPTHPLQVSSWPILETALPITETEFRKHYSIQTTPQNLGKITSETTRMCLFFFSHCNVQKCIFLKGPNGHIMSLLTPTY